MEKENQKNDKELKNLVERIYNHSDFDDLCDNTNRLINHMETYKDEYNYKDNALELKNRAMSFMRYKQKFEYTEDALRRMVIDFMFEEYK